LRMATTVVQVQTATATAGEDHGPAILDGAPKKKGLTTWIRGVRRARREPQPRALRVPLATHSHPRTTDSGVPSLVSATETISATTSEESRRAAPSVQTRAQARQAGPTGTGMLDVEVRLTVQEKLRTLVFASALGLKADRTADFTQREEEALRRFQAAYDADRIIWFRGKRMPSVIFELVALRSGSTGSGSDHDGKSGTSICVRGLHSDDDIKKFHEIMSVSAIRRLHAGLRLSYDKTLIQRPAKELDEEYDHLPSSLGETLCGTRLVTRRPGHSEWSSTIGGIIQIQDELYALTSSHTPDDDEFASRIASLEDVSKTSTLVGSDYDDDVESALILDLPTLGKSVSGGDKHGERGDSRATPSHFWPTFSVRGPAWEHRAHDWRLIRPAQHQCFPNSLSQAPEDSTVAKRRYITEPRYGSPSRGKVSILAGFSGHCRGVLLASPAFLSIRGAGPIEVWTVVLDDNSALQKGDSGSWVVDDQGRWIGTVTAMAGGDAYLILAQAQLTQIQSHLDLPVYLPSPLRCYLELASDKSCPRDAADAFAAMALTPDVLLASASDMGVMALTLAIATTEPMRWLQVGEAEGLAMVLRVLGVNLQAELERGPDLRSFEFDLLRPLREIYHSIMADYSLLGSRADIQKVLEGRKPAIDSDSISPQHQGVSSDAATKPGLPLPEPTEEKPSETPGPFAMPPHTDEGTFSTRSSS